MQLRNDKERRAFLDDYRNEHNGWKLWKSDEEMERRLWRNDMQDVTLVVEEERRTFLYPAKHSDWIVMHYYAAGAVIPAGARWKHHFGDYQISKTAVMGILKLYKSTEGGG